MSQQEVTADTEVVDKLWKLKVRAQQVLGLHIPFQMLLKDGQYRQKIVLEAERSGDPGLQAIVAEVQQRRAQTKAPRKAPPLLQEPVQVIATPSTTTPSNKYNRWLLGTNIVAILLFLSWFAVQFVPLQSATPTGVVVAPQVVDADLALSVAPPLPLQVLPVAEPEVVLRLHGSNTVGESLAPALLEGYLASQGITQQSWVVGDSPVERQLQYVEGDRVYAIELHAHGSSTGFASLIDSKADMAMSSRRIKDKEWQVLKAPVGDLRLSQNEHIVGLDGLAVIVHIENPINQLTVPQIAKVFSGEIQNWQQLGGPDLPIRRYARDQHSGTWDTFKNLVLKPYKQSLATDAQRFESSTKLSSLVAADRAAIGFIGLPYVNQSKLLAVAASDKALAIVPTRFTVSTEDYPLARRLFLYTPTQASEFIRGLVQFSLGQQGQQQVQEVGLVSQNLRMEDPAIPASAPQKYVSLAQRAKRLSVNFRFNSGSTYLDNKAQQDLNRVIEFKDKHPGRIFILMGFSDSVGDPQQNRVLSVQRAHQLEKALIAHGVVPAQILGMGEQMPVASNRTSEGRRRNRRVEIWVI